MIPNPSLTVPRGPYQGSAVIGEVTEALHGFIHDGWPDASDAPIIVEDLDHEPADRQKVIFIYMYRVARNTALMNSKRWRESRVTTEGDDGKHFYERPPLYLDLYYLISVHAKFRSEAEKLMGWLLLRLNEATHLVYRPRRYVLPDLAEVDSSGKPWSIQNRGENVVMEKVSLDLVDDLTIGDAVNFFNIHDAPFRPYVTYRARCAMEGSLVEAQATTIRSLPLADATKGPPPEIRPNGRVGPAGRARLGPSASSSRTTPHRMPFGPEGHDRKKITDQPAPVDEPANNETTIDDDNED